jgi:hypothetical protein
VCDEHPSPEQLEEIVLDRERGVPQHAVWPVNLLPVDVIGKQPLYFRR